MLSVQPPKSSSSGWGSGPLDQALQALQGRSIDPTVASKAQPFAQVASKLSALRDAAAAAEVAPQGRRDRDLLDSGNSSSKLGNLQGSRTSKQPPLKLQLQTTTRANNQPSASVPPPTQTLVRGIRQILDFGTQLRQAALDYNSLYRQCDLLASYSQRTGQDKVLQDLYESVQMEMERSLTALTKQLRSTLPHEGQESADTPQREQEWLAAFAKSWTAWKERTNLAANILLPLDRAAFWGGSGGVGAKHAAQQSTAEVEMRDASSSGEKRMPIKALAIDSFAYQVMKEPSLEQTILPFTTRAIDTFVRRPQVEDVPLLEPGADIKGKKAGLSPLSIPPLSAEAESFKSLYVQSILTLFTETGTYDSLKEAHHKAAGAFYGRVAQDRMLKYKEVAPPVVESPATPSKGVNTAVASAEGDEDDAKRSMTVQKKRTPSYAALYLQWFRRAVDCETEQCQWLYNTEDTDDSLRIVLQKCLKDHIDDIVAGLPTVFDNVDLGALHVLCGYSDRDLCLTMPNLGDKPAPPGSLMFRLRKSFADFLVTRVTAIVTDQSRDEEMIARLLDLKSNADSMVSNAFNENGNFAASQRDSFATGVNKRENKPPELIAKHLDTLLKSGNKTMTDAQLEQSLNDALTLFRFAKDKDMFEEFYTRHFARRLLLNKSASSDAEMSMLLKLKEECGPDFTRKLETMLKDITLSDDIMKSWEVFEAKTRDTGELPYKFDLSVSVLTQAHWPTYPQVDLILPKDMEAAAETFKVFYQGRNSGRRLYWQHSLGSNTVTAEMGKAGQKEFHVSTPQAVVLLLFNSLAPGQSLTYKSILAQTGMDPTELKRTLQSLACGQIPTRVLRKTPQGKDVNDDDSFIVNENLKNDRARIRINQIQERQTVEEQKETEQHVLLERELVLQAAAVRVMKAKKTVKHSDLVNEVIEQIKGRFAIESTELKKVFESLIEKDYMERVEGQRGVYRYVA